MWIQLIYSFTFAPLVSHFHSNELYAFSFIRSLLRGEKFCDPDLVLWIHL